MLGMATLTTNRSKIVTKPASSRTDKPSHGGPLTARAGSAAKQEFEFILRIPSKDAIILESLLNNYNLTAYAIT